MSRLSHWPVTGSDTSSVASRHGLRMPREEKAITARLKIQIFRYGQRIFCLPHRPKFSDFFDLCLHWVSVVRASICTANFLQQLSYMKTFSSKLLLSRWFVTFLYSSSWNFLQNSMYSKEFGAFDKPARIGNSFRILSGWIWVHLY